MDISATRVTSLINEALAPLPVPAAKADPATTALLKALVQPPTPPVAQSAQLTAQGLEGSLQRPGAQRPQRLSTGEIEDAYRAILEPDGGMDDAPGRASTGRPAADPDQPRSGLVQPAVADSSAKAAAAPPPSSFSPAFAAAAALVAANSNAPHMRGAAAPRGHAPRSEPAQSPLLMMSIVTAAISAVVATIVVLLLR